MNIMCPPLEEIKGLSANEILQKFNQYDNVPVDIKAILDDMGAILIEDDLSFIEKDMDVKKDIEKYGELCGFVIADRNVLAIFYKNINTDLTDEKTIKSANNRTRFTLAHELAHCVLHAGDCLNEGYLEYRHDNKNIDITKCKRDSYEYKEYYANIFAGQLLVPDHSLRKIYEDLIEPSLSVLCDIFKVSANVMRERLKILNLPYLEDFYSG